MKPISQTIKPPQVSAAPSSRRRQARHHPPIASPLATNDPTRSLHVANGDPPKVATPVPDVLLPVSHAHAFQGNSSQGTSSRPVEKAGGSFGGRVRAKRDAGPPSVRLACKRMAFVYQRLSTTEQKKNSRYSLERQDDLERLAREDGYAAELIYVERRDLGVSGTKGQEEREGLAYLIQLIEQGKVESVYVIEISRISRDQTLINGLQFGELCREQNVIIVTPTMRLNLRDEMHLRMYRYEIDRAAEELKSIRFRMQGAKVMKARHGYNVGNSLPPGYILDTDERLPNGTLNPNHQKYKIYEPHAQVVRTLFRRMAEPGTYLKGVALECQRTGLVFAQLPEELLAVKGNAASFARTSPNPDGGFPITVGRLESIVSNPAYIGWFIWSGEVISQNNHPAIIDEDTFWTVQKKRRWKGVRRTEFFEPLPLSGLLYCGRHDPARRMIASNTKNRNLAQYHCRDEDAGPSCLNIFSYILEDPIAEFIIAQCSFPQYADQVLDRLSHEYEEAKDKVAANKREYQRIIDEIENLKSNLGRTRTPDQVDMLLEMIDAKVKEKEHLASMDSQPMGQVLSAAEVATVKEFLAHIDTRWAGMTDGVKNTFLSLLLERIDIQHDENRISARVIWRTGMRQYLSIQRPFIDTREPWTPEEDAILREHYSKTSQQELCALLHGRGWGAIRKRAGQLRLQRPVEVRTIVSSNTSYSEEEDQVIRDFHAFKITRTEMLERLADRSEDAIYARGAQLGFKRRKRFVKWEQVPEELFESGESEMDVAQEVTTKDTSPKTKSSRSAERKARSRFRQISCSSRR